MHPYAGTERALEGTPFAQITYVIETGSTNEDAAALLGDESSRGRTLIAEYQTHGAGRKGRTWVAPPGTSLLFTTILPDPLPTSELWIVPFWVALAVQSALQEHNIGVSLHWPNDLLIGSNKVSGILCASRVWGAQSWVACGIGINVRRTPSARDITPPPAFCNDVHPVERDTLLTSVLLKFNASLEMLKAPSAVARAWESRAGLPGQRYRLLRDGGEIPFDATAIALTETGALLVERDDGTREVVALADARALR